MGDETSGGRGTYCGMALDATRGGGKLMLSSTSNCEPLEVFEYRYNMI